MHGWRIAVGGQHELYLVATTSCDQTWYSRYLRYQSIVFWETGTWRAQVNTGTHHTGTLPITFIPNRNISGSTLFRHIELLGINLYARGVVKNFTIYSYIYSLSCQNYVSLLNIHLRFTYKVYTATDVFVNKLLISIMIGRLPYIKLTII